MFNYYIYKVTYYNPVTMIYYCNEYEFAGIQPDTDTPIYKHRRSIEIPREEIYNYYIEGVSDHGKTNGSR